MTELQIITSDVPADKHLWQINVNVVFLPARMIQ